MHTERYPAWLMKRFWAKVDKEPGGCWTWVAAKNGGGYGMFRDSVAATKVDVHRFSWEYHVGPIGDGLVIDHLCRNRACVNPEHMEPVTQRVNNLRGAGGMAAINEAKTHCIHGHVLAGENVRLGSDGARHCRACHRRRMKERKMRPDQISQNQMSALVVAHRTGRWWVNGKGSNMIVAGLVDRGLAEKHWELLLGRARHYLVTTDAGRVLVEGRDGQTDGQNRAA